MCSSYDKSFLRKDEFRVHMRSHEVLDKDHLICDECGVKLKSYPPFITTDRLYITTRYLNAHCVARCLHHFIAVSAMDIAWANLYYDCIWGVPKGESLKRKTLL